jgi:hypothetical protein
MLLPTTQNKTGDQTLAAFCFRDQVAQIDHKPQTTAP